MNKTATVLSQFQSLFSRSKFEKLVIEYNADKNVRSFSTWNLFTVMLFAHVTTRKSFRDICATLKSKGKRWYHLGLEAVSRNNLSNSLAKRSAEIFEKAFFLLAEKVTTEKSGNCRKFRFMNPLYAIDSTTIGLCLSVFVWASFKSTKAGIKAHTMYDVKNGIPSFIYISNANMHDQKAMPVMPIKKGDIVALDRAYLCFKTLENINKNKAFFVTRTKSNTQYRVIKKLRTKSRGVKSDFVIEFTGAKAREYSDHLRLVVYVCPEDKKKYLFITNNFSLSAKTIADIYKSRWQIELFFKWIKQNVKIKAFFGTGENAVRIQIWTAAIAYLLSEYIRFLSKTVFSLTQVFRLIGSNLFERRCIVDLLTAKPPTVKKRNVCLDAQLDFEF
jgi:hypothetical protein